MREYVSQHRNMVHRLVYLMIIIVVYLSIIIYTLWGSTDWSHWTKLASGEFSNIVNNPIWQTIKLKPTKIRMLKFDADRLASGERMGYGDIEVVTE